jgi:hydrogenase-4 component E
MLALLVSRPILVLGPGPAVAAVPVGVALVLYGFLVLATRRHAISQVVGFLMLDNGIATVAFLTAGGVPFVVELGASLDVLLVVLVLQVLTSRIRTEFGATDLDDLTELRD